MASKQLATCVFALMLATSLLTACGSSGSTDTSDNTTATEETAATDEKSGDVAKGEDGKSQSDSEKKSSDDASASLQRVGADGIGYVSLPSTWTPFEDVDGNSSLQWCDGTPNTVISLNLFDLSDASEEERAQYSVEDAANSVAYNMLNDGAVEDSLTGAHVTLAERDAMQVYALYPDGSYLVAWLLNDDEGQIRYVAAEGTEETIYTAVGYVEQGYEL